MYGAYSEVNPKSHPEHRTHVHTDDFENNTYMSINTGKKYIFFRIVVLTMLVKQVMFYLIA